MSEEIKPIAEMSPELKRQLFGHLTDQTYTEFQALNKAIWDLLRQQQAEALHRYEVREMQRLGLLP